MHHGDLAALGKNHLLRSDWVVGGKAIKEPILQTHVIINDFEATKEVPLHNFDSLVLIIEITKLIRLLLSLQR